MNTVESNQQIGHKMRTSSRRHGVNAETVDANKYMDMVSQWLQIRTIANDTSLPTIIRRTAARVEQQVAIIIISTSTHYNVDGCCTFASILCIVFVTRRISSVQPWCLVCVQYIYTCLSTVCYVSCICDTNDGSSNMVNIISFEIYN